MNAVGIYSIHHGPQLSEREIALLESLPDAAKLSRPATHHELRIAIVELAKRHGYVVEVEESSDDGFIATIARDLRVVAHVRGNGDQTFYCQAESDTLLRQLAEEIARVCGPQLVLPSTGDDAVLVIASN